MNGRMKIKFIPEWVRARSEYDARKANEAREQVVRRENGRKKEKRKKEREEKERKRRERKKEKRKRK